MYVKAKKLQERITFPSFFEYQKQRIFPVGKTLIIIGTLYVFLFAIYDIYHFPEYLTIILITRFFSLFFLSLILGLYYFWHDERYFSFSLSTMTVFSAIPIIYLYLNIPEKSLLIIVINMYFYASAVVLSPILEKKHLVVAVILCLVSQLIMMSFLETSSRFLTIMSPHMVAISIFFILISFKTKDSSIESYFIAKGAHDGLFKDHLTQILNRKGILTWISENKESRQFSDNKTSILMIDLDNLKSVNDAFGHDSGDQVIAKTAQIIKSNIGKKSKVGRLGGEEFLAVIVADSYQEIEIISQNVLKAIGQQKFEYKNQEFGITASIGVSKLNDVSGFNSSFKKADELMYKAKTSGKNKCISDFKSLVNA